MTCELCGENEATVHLTEIIDDQSRQLHLCESCARERGASAVQNFGLADLLAGLTDLSSKRQGQQAAPRLACPSCGMTYEDFRKSGRLGCGACYRAFQRYLAPLLKKIHGSTLHTGRAPAAGQKETAKATDFLKTLRAQLMEAIEQEAFEKAARLRDQIRALESGGWKMKRGGKGKKSEQR